MTDHVETVIIGGGQAGLSVSYYLSREGRSHVVLERAAQAGEAWRNHRWDSFTLVSANWMTRLPGAEYAGHDPDGFMSRDDVVKYFEQYAARFRMPVRYQHEVTSVERENHGYRVATNQGAFEAANVVLATGSFQRPRIPAFGASLPRDIVQLTSDSYRNPGALLPGAVLVVGSAQSGCQIAEELYRAGRQVFLCVGSAGRVPRRYRGKDITWWLSRVGFFDRTVDELPSPRAKFAPNPQLSGQGGGRTLNLHQFARDGVGLLGHLRDAQGTKLRLAPDLYDSLAKVDQFEVDILALIDAFAARSGIDAPREELEPLRDGYAVEAVTELDVRAAGITTVLWAAGYEFDYRLVREPVFDDDGYPVHKGGVSASPGLYFVGLSWLSKHKSALLLGVGEDAWRVASRIITGEAHAN